jgi:hypothetical protein
MTHTNTMIFTRLLYLKDEVMYSFVSTIINDEPSDKPLFWFSELYFSKFYDECIQLIYFVYFNFYALHHPSLITLIDSNILRWREEMSKTHSISIYTIDTLYDILFAFMKCHKSSLLFEAYFSSKNNLLKKITLYRGKKPNSLSTYSTKIQVFIHSILKKNLKNIIYYFQNIPVDDIHDALQDFYGIPLDNDLNRLLYFVFQKVVLFQELPFQNINVSSIRKHYDFNFVFGGQNKKLLAKYRHYAIEDNIGVFNLDRFTLPDHDTLKNAYWHKWEYFSQHCPYWKEKFDEFDAAFDHENEKLIFENDDTLEDFYENYNLEPDEQNNETQSKSLKMIEPSDIISYLKGYSFMKSLDTDYYK